MSKNVAVFVDVANIFYAAKAAGVDIDYVTLLKAATAGRDLVRAYAYTGLDPENENQRQFHSFLARSGYKVVSKDIRKYGDGRIKANLDIELVVDLMRTARNLDVAVVVSGDGDFAPAIRAVQQTGVRVEVVSFRGNTSSDLIEVADVFTDITQIARVDKGTSRSGRRVAAEGDLSMTEVPDKETESGVRRRRGGRGRDRDERPAALPAVAMTDTRPGNIIVLPGERLSRVGSVPVTDGELAADEALEPVALVAEMDENTLSTATEDPGAEGRRRRRRRGGRGRGRGRGVDAEPGQPSELALENEIALEQDDDELLEPEAPRVPQHSTFGSVWDTQLGVPTASLAPTVDVEDEEFEDEPEIPEYLLAERRQRAQRGRGGVGPMAGRGRGGRAAAGYQAAVERERYGRGGGVPGGNFGGPRRDDRPRGPRPPAAAQPPRLPRPERGPRRHEEPQPRQASAGEPWTEVPPELEEMLRQELARKTGAAPVAGERSESARMPERAPASDDVTEEFEPVAGRDLADEDGAGSVADVPPAAVTTAVQPEPTATRRGRTRAIRSEPANELAGAGAAAEITAEASEPAARPARRRRSAEGAASTGSGGDVAGASAAASDATSAAAPAGPEPGEAAPTRRPRRRGATEATADEGAGSAPEAGAEAAPAAPARRRATRSRATAAGTADTDGTAATSEPRAEDAPTPESAPKRRGTGRRAAESEA